MRRLIVWVLTLLLGLAAYVFLSQPQEAGVRLPSLPPLERPSQTSPQDAEVPSRWNDALLQRSVDAQPISLASLRARTYPGSALNVERTLAPGAGYTRQVVSYRSDGLKIYGLLTVPSGTPPPGGWPGIVFNHGYIPPAEYRTTERYVAYQDAFARAGFVTLKSDYRGHGDSEGEARGGYNDPGYTVDVLNAAASLKSDPRVNARRLGLWGHSMGGQLSLRAMLVDPDLKAASLWAGVMAGYDVLATDWNPPAGEQRPLDDFNRRYLRLLSPNASLGDLRGRPLQLHHGTADKDVPYSFQVALANDMRAAGQPFTAFKYEGDDHNLSGNLGLALRRSVQFFKDQL